MPFSLVQIFRNSSLAPFAFLAYQEAMNRVQVSVLADIRENCDLPLIIPGARFSGHGKFLLPVLLDAASCG